MNLHTVFGINGINSVASIEYKQKQVLDQSGLWEWNTKYSVSRIRKKTNICNIFARRSDSIKTLNISPI